MSNNLDLLRQDYCEPATFTGEPIHTLFPLERECEEGRIVLENAPATLLHVQEFDPTGLRRTYLDDSSGAELPLFAIFNLDGPRQCSFEVTAELPAPVPGSVDLQQMMPLDKAQPFVRKINKKRMKADRLSIIVAGLIGIAPALAFLVSPIGEAAGAKVPFVVLGGWLLGAMLVYVLMLSLLDRYLPWKKLVITAEFNGLLPRETRKRAMEARDHFDNLYVIIDQQGRWQSELLPDPAPRGMDPLLIGELNQSGRTRYYLIHQFDLTQAEQYLADEFAIRLN